MKLVIVESPSKVKKVGEYLGKDYLVMASVGHVRDLPVGEYVYIDKRGKEIKYADIRKLEKEDKKLVKKIPSIDKDNNFKPYYIISDKKKHVIQDLLKSSDKADEVILATDPDREGEAIAWHIADELGLKNSSRITYTSITKDAIQNAIKNKRGIDMNLKEAQEARRILDRLFGYDLSSLVWQKVRYGLSAGRVQSPALRILVEREKEINAFIGEKYFEITGEYKTIGKAKESKTYTLEFNCDEVPDNEKRSIDIKTFGENANWTITDIKQSNAKRSPNPPLITSTLQQAASNRYGYSPSRTMQIAQKLYEKGLITYMRTDSPTLTPEAINAIKDIIVKKYGIEMWLHRDFKTKNKNSQEAHEAIRPTDFENINAGTTEDEKKIYKLIWQKAIASQMIDAENLRTKVIISGDNKNLPTFSLNGNILTKDGWLIVDIEAKGEEKELPKLEINQNIKCNTIHYEEKTTQPPNRYTEAGLIKELEKRGIGRPSTYASIISTIIDRGYVEKQGRTLFPNKTAEVVIDFLNNNFKNYISDDFTSNMENDLDDIAEGKNTYLKVIKSFYDKFSNDIKDKKDIGKVTNISLAPESIRCPICGSSMVEKLSKNGSFYSCSNFPECQGARKIDGSIMEAPKTLDKECPKCLEKGIHNKLIEREGKYGKFVSCSSYPKCKYIEKSEEEKQKSLTGVKCNVCQDGYMEERRGRFGIFYSCSNYPECKNAIKAKPTGNICELCGSLKMEGTKTIPERCSNKSCPNHNPHKLQK